MLPSRDDALAAGSGLDEAVVSSVMFRRILGGEL